MLTSKVEAPNRYGHLPVALQAFVRDHREWSVLGHQIPQLALMCLFAVAVELYDKEWDLAWLAAVAVVLCVVLVPAGLLPALRRAAKAGYSVPDLVRVLANDPRNGDYEWVQAGQPVKSGPLLGGVGAVLAALGMAGITGWWVRVGVYSVGGAYAMYLVGASMAVWSTFKGAGYLRYQGTMPGDLWLRILESPAGEWLGRVAAWGVRREPRAEPPEIAMLSAPSWEERTRDN